MELSRIRSDAASSGLSTARDEAAEAAGVGLHRAISLAKALLPLIPGGSGPPLACFTPLHSVGGCSSGARSGGLSQALGSMGAAAARGLPWDDGQGLLHPMCFVKWEAVMRVLGGCSNPACTSQLVGECRVTCKACMRTSYCSLSCLEQAGQGLHGHSCQRR